MNTKLPQITSFHLGTVPKSKKCENLASPSVKLKQEFVLKCSFHIVHLTKISSFIANKKK